MKQITNCVLVAILLLATAQVGLGAITIPTGAPSLTYGDFTVYSCGYLEYLYPRVQGSLNAWRH